MPRDFAIGKIAVAVLQQRAVFGNFHCTCRRRQETRASIRNRTDAAALALAANNLEIGYSTLSIRAATPIGNDMVLIPRASAAGQHAFNDVTPLETLAFQSASVPFVIAGAPIACDSLLAEAGLDLAFGRNATVGLPYTGQFARNVEDHAAKGKFSRKF